MRRLITFIALGLLFTGVWFGVWSWMMADNVAQVEKTLNHHNQQFKTVTPNMVLKADSVSASGFPFKFRVKIEQLNWSMVENKETYLMRFDVVYLEPKRGGDYRVQFRDELDALYAKDGEAPEHYHVTISDVPGLVLRPEKMGEVLTQYKVFLPPSITMRMDLGQDSRQATFEMPKVNFLTFTPIPKDVERPLWLFVGVLREALVFKTAIDK